MSIIKQDFGELGGGDVKFKTGTFIPSTSVAVSVDVGFKPKYLAVFTYKTDGTTLSISYIYNEEVSTTQYVFGASDANSSFKNLNNSNNYELKSIDSNGFTINKYTSSNWNGTGYYFAVG